MNELTQFVEEIDSKESFLTFISLLTKDLMDDHDGWENKTLSSYLTALGSWAEDMDGYYDNKGIPRPQNVNWKVFAEILSAARVYE